MMSISISISSVAHSTCVISGNDGVRRRVLHSRIFPVLARVCCFCGPSRPGCFAATFPLVFSYIGDLVPPPRRAPAYGLALATFGLSFSLG